jgi:hypothetical protein
MGGTREIILDFCHGSCHLKRIPDFLAASGVRSFLRFARACPHRGGRPVLFIIALPSWSTEGWPLAASLIPLTALLPPRPALLPASYFRPKGAHLAGQVAALLL